MSNLKDKLAKAWAGDLQARVPAGHRVFPNRRPRRGSNEPEIQPPFTVLTVMRMEQTTPGSNVWTAAVRVVVVCDKDQADSPEQERRVGEIYRTLEATVRPAMDEENGVLLYGHSVDEIEQAKADKVYSDVIFITAGVGDLESSPGAAIVE